MSAKTRDDRKRRLFEYIGTSCTVLTLLILMAAPVLHAGSLESSILGMFPSNVSEVGYADLTAARQFPWFPQFEAQVVPVSLYGFEQFLGAAQMQQMPVIEQVAWARIGSLNMQSPTGKPEPGDGQIVAVAEGHFDLGALQSFLGARAISGKRIGAAVMYAAGTGSGASDVFFVLVSDETIAFGGLDALKRLLGTNAGEEENLLTNEKMMALIGRVNGDGVFWGVFGAGGAQMAVQQLLPEVAKFPQGIELLGKLKAISIAVKTPSDIELDFQAVAASPGDALLLSQLLQVGLLYRQQQSNQNNSDLGHILSSTSISSNGSVLDISIDVNDDQVLSLIENDIFRMPM